MKVTSQKIFKWGLSFREPLSENEYIEFLIKKIRRDVDIYRGFEDLMERKDGKHPAIISKWRPRKSGELLYLGYGQPTDEEMCGKKAIAWLVSRGIAEPEADNQEKEHWYFLTVFGRKVKEKYEELYVR